MKKVMIVLGVFIVLISAMIAGCGKSEGEKKEALVGTYVNKDDSSEYFVLEEDGTYRYQHEKFGYDLTGEWEAKSNKLIVSYPTTGPMPPSTIKGNKIIGDDGSVHIKVKERNPASLKEVKEINEEKTNARKRISKNSIVGEYSVEAIKKDGQQRSPRG